MLTDKKCKFCGKGFLVREEWSDSELYCNNCFKRPAVDRSSRSGVEVESESEEVEEELSFPWWNTKGW